MTLPKRSLHPASGDDRRTFLRALELVAGIGVQLAQIRRAVVGQRMPLEPCPQVFDRIQVWRIGRQEGQLDMTAQPVQIFAHQFAAVRLQPVPDNQQWLFEVRLECLQEFDDLFFPDASLVQAEQAYLKRWTAQPAPGQSLQPEVFNKVQEWLVDDGRHLNDWDISRDPPYFGIEIPDQPEGVSPKYFYVWLDAPIGYLAALKKHFDSGAARKLGDARSFDEFIASPDVEQYHFIGKDIVYFHT